MGRVILKSANTCTLKLKLTSHPAVVMEVLRRQLSEEQKITVFMDTQKQGEEVQLKASMTGIQHGGRISETGRLPGFIAK